MIGRTLWVVCCALLALITLQLQFDRQSVREPSYARLVLEPFRANAQFILTARALYRQETDTALAQARKLIMRRPVPAEHLTLLAGAFYQDENIEAASLAVQFAAQRGWRDGIAQEARLGLALEAGDEAEAARRFVAIMLDPGSDTARLRELGTLIFTDGQGDAEGVLIDLVSETDRWHRVFLRRGSEVLPPMSFARVIKGGIARDAPFACSALRSAVAIVERREKASGEALRPAIDARC